MPPRWGPQWLFKLLLVTAFFLPPVSASPIYPRVGDTPAEQQVSKAIQSLSKDLTHLVAGPTIKLDKINKDLKEVLGNRKLKVVFAMFAGTFGDVGKSEYYMVELDKTKEFDIRMVSDRRNDKYLAKSFKEKYSGDINKCGTNKPWEAFRECFATAMSDFKPDVVVRANPVYRAYDDNEKGLYAKLREPVDKCIKDSKCILIDVKAFWEPPKDMEQKSKEWNEYHFNVNEVDVVGQIPFWYDNPDPATTHQILVGHAETYRDPELLEQPLQDFLKDAKKNKQRIMYLGQGAQQRPEEASMKTPTKALEEFYTTQLKTHKDWRFIILHNIREEDKKDATKPPVTNDGRVYHVWFPQNLPELWKQVDLVLHHGGAGSFSDSIIAGVPQICMPQGKWSPDQKVWADLAKKHEIGSSVPPINFKEHYDGDELDKLFNQISEDLPKMRANVGRIQAQYKDVSAARLTVEMTKRLSLARLERTKGCGHEKRDASKAGTSAGRKASGSACPTSGSASATGATSTKVHSKSKASATGTTSTKVHSGNKTSATKATSTEVHSRSKASSTRATHTKVHSSSRASATKATHTKVHPSKQKTKPTKGKY